MALTPEEQSVSLQVSQAVLSQALSGSVAAFPLAPVLALVPPAIGLAATLFRTRFPQLDPGDISRAIAEKQRLERMGLEPVITSDPFFGDVVIGTADQNIPLLVAEAAARRVLTPTPQETDELSALRRQLIDVKRETAVARGFFPSTGAIPPEFTNVPGRRCGFFRETATSPAQFRCF